MKLKDAIERYKQEENTPANAYGWYRKSAKDSGKISIAGVDIRTNKQDNVWYVGGKEFLIAIVQHKIQIEKNKTKYKRPIQWHHSWQGRRYH